MELDFHLSGAKKFSCLIFFFTRTLNFSYLEL